MNLIKTPCFVSLVFLFLVVFVVWPAASNAAGSVLINEIAWMGTAANSADEWAELYNSSAGAVDLTGWGLYEAGGGTLILNLSGTIAANGYYLIERTDDNSVSDIAADVFGPFAGSGLNNSGEYLVLKNSAGSIVDSVDAASGWPAGDNAAKASMERKADLSWQTNDGVTKNGKDATGGPIAGTPKAANSGTGATISTSTPQASPPSQTVSSGSGSISVPLLPVLKAEAGADVVIEVGMPLAFSGLTSQGATAYKWYLGDGTIKTGAEITHTYQFPGTYLVTLEVGNGTDTHTDQLRAFVFGGKVLISEIFVGTASTTGGWIEIYNPLRDSADLSGWILESGGRNFVMPPFVVVTPGGFLVLDQKTIGLDWREGSIKLKYPNGTAVDEVVFEKIMPNSSASRGSSGFFWSREATPGRANIILSSAFSEKVAVVPKKVVFSPESSQPVNYLASFYATVETPPVPVQNTLAAAGEVVRETGFGKKLLESMLFWVVIVAVFGLMAGFLYIRIKKP